MKLKRWRGWLGSDRDGDARQNILAIDDPAAVAALDDGLVNESADEVRILYVEALARIGVPDAIQALAVCSMEDPVEEVRLTCLDNLQKTHSPEVVSYYVGRLRDKDNRKVNLAAVGLRRMKNASAVGPLIDALVTVHKFKIVTSNPGSMSSTFGTGPGGSGAPGGGGLSVGGGPKIFDQSMQNRPVLEALIELTGRNYGFDEQAWKNWYASQKKPETEAVDVRRD